MGWSAAILLFKPQSMVFYSGNPSKLDNFILFLANKSYENSAKTHKVYKVSKRRKKEKDELPRVLRKIFFFVSYQS